MQGVALRKCLQSLYLSLSKHASSIFGSIRCQSFLIRLLERSGENTGIIVAAPSRTRLRPRCQKIVVEFLKCFLRAYAKDFVYKGRVIFGPTESPGPIFVDHFGTNPGALLVVSRLNCLSSMKSESDVEPRTATVADFIAVQASRFNSFQHPKIFALLNLNGFREGSPGRADGPEPAVMLRECPAKSSLEGKVGGPPQALLGS